MITRVAIVSPPGEDLERARAAFRNPMKFVVREFLSMPSVLHDLISFPMEILVMRIPNFEPRHIEIAGKALRRFHLASVVILAKQIDPSAQYKASKMERFKVLQEPFEVADLASVAEKLHRGDHSALRLHSRARRSDAVQIVDSHGQIHHGRFLDFAQMGARLSVPTLQKLQPRTSVQIVYGSTSAPGTIKRIEAKIVWSAIANGFVDQIIRGACQTAGVRFIAAY